MEYVRVPVAEENCIQLLGEANDEHEEDFLMLADIFPLPLGKMWNEGLTVGIGQTPVKHISLMLPDLIVQDVRIPETSFRIILSWTKLLKRIVSSISVESEMAKRIRRL